MGKPLFQGMVDADATTVGGLIVLFMLIAIAFVVKRVRDRSRGRG